MNKSQEVLKLFTNTNLSKDILEYLTTFLNNLKNKFNSNTQWSNINISENHSSFEIYLIDSDNTIDFDTVNKIFIDYMMSFKLKKQLREYFITEVNGQYKFTISLREPYYRIWNYKIPFLFPNN